MKMYAVDLEFKAKTYFVLNNCLYITSYRQVPTFDGLNSSSKTYKAANENNEECKNVK